MLTDKEILTKAYSAFNARNIVEVLAVMHADVNWSNGMEGGRVRGHQGVRDYWTRQWNLVDPHVEPRGYSMEEDGSIVVDVHQVVRDLAGNVLLDGMVQHIYHIQDNLILRMDIRK